MKYIGQRGRPFKVRFQEHFRDLKYGSGKSRFAQHLPTPTGKRAFHRPNGEHYGDCPRNK